MDAPALFDRAQAPAAPNSAPPSASMAASTEDSPTLASSGAHALLDRGQVALDGEVLRRLRQSRLLSQQDLADDCWRRNIRVSIATIKRAESGRAVRFRIARELARCFGIPVVRILRADPSPPGVAGGAHVGKLGWTGIELIPLRVGSDAAFAVI
ncbi:MAG: helix-turn-helix domain-containing protein [Tahibacter sp.]